MLINELAIQIVCECVSLIRHSPAAYSVSSDSMTLVQVGLFSFSRRREGERERANVSSDEDARHTSYTGHRVESIAPEGIDVITRILV